MERGTQTCHRVPCAMQSCTHSKGKGDLSYSAFLPPVLKSCWDGKVMLGKNPASLGIKRKSHSRHVLSAFSSSQLLPTLTRALSTIFHFSIQSIRNPCLFCIFPILWHVLLLDRTLGAQVGYKNQLKPVGFFIHVIRFFWHGRGRGGNAQNKRN